MLQSLFANLDGRYYNAPITITNLKVLKKRLSGILCVKMYCYEQALAIVTLY